MDKFDSTSEESLEADRDAALESLRRGWLIADRTGLSNISAEEIDAEIAAVRAARIETCPRR